MPRNKHIRSLSLGLASQSGQQTFARSITPTLGAELSGNVDLALDTWWTKAGGWTIGGGVASHSATGANDALSRASTLTVGQWYRYTWDIVAKSSAAGTNCWAGVGTPSDQLRTAIGSYVDIGKTGSTTLAWFALSTFVGSIDNLSCKNVVLSSCLASRRVTPSGDVIAEAAVTVIPGTQIGVSVNIDDPANPLNMVTAYINGTKIYLDKRVGGTSSNVLNSAITYVAGQKVKIVKSGTTYKLYYNDIQIGADQTIADAGVIGNTNHMQFSTYELNTFGSWSAIPN